jgi:hypothetical protein
MPHVHYSPFSQPLEQAQVKSRRETDLAANPAKWDGLRSYF